MRSNQWFLKTEGGVLRGKKALVNFIDNKGQLLGRKNGNEKHLKVFHCMIKLNSAHLELYLKEAKMLDCT